MTVTVNSVKDLFAVFTVTMSRWVMPKDAQDKRDHPTFPAGPDNGTELSLDEIAEHSGVSTRSIRYYQSQGLLEKPRRDGRDARYNAQHIERLTLIAEMQERGLKLEAIRSLLGRDGNRHRSVTDWLGLDEALRDRWVQDQPATMTLTEVHRLLDARPKRLVGELVDEKVIERQADGTFLIPSPAMLSITLRLSDAHVNIDVATRAADLLRRRLNKAAEDLVALFNSETGRSFAGKGTPKEVSVALEAVRPIALDAAAVILAQEMERALHKLASAGIRRR